MITSNNLVETDSNHLTLQIRNLTSFYSLLIQLTRQLDPKLSKIAFDAATILTRHFSILPDVENSKNRSQYANYEPSHFVHNSGNHINLKGFVPQSYCQLEYYAFLNEAAVRKAIKFLIDRNICTGVVKCTTKGYYFNLNSLDIDLGQLITTSRRYWGNEELLVAANSFIYQMRKKVIDKNGKEVSTSYLEGRRALAFFSYINDKAGMPSNSTICKELRFDRDFLIGLIDSLQKGKYLTLLDFFIINWKKVLSCEFPLKRQLDFKENNYALQLRNRMTKTIDWKFVNELSTSPHLFGKSMLSLERSMVIYIISTLAKRREIDIWWDFRAINVIMKTFSSVSTDGDQRGELLKRCSYKTIEDLFDRFAYNKDSDLPWFVQLLHWYSEDCINKEGVKDFNEFKGPYLAEYFVTEDSRVGKLQKMNNINVAKLNSALAIKDTTARDFKLSEHHVEVALTTDWTNHSDNYEMLKNDGFHSEYAYFISEITKNAKEYLNYDVEWEVINLQTFFHSLGLNTIYTHDEQLRGFNSQLYSLQHVDKSIYTTVFKRWNHTKINSAEDFFLTFIDRFNKYKTQIS